MSVTQVLLPTETASSARPASLTLDSNYTPFNLEFHDETPLKIFSGLPDLHHGHPDVHLRKGIMNASLAALEDEDDAEKAFFVADLGQVYSQHMRWEKNLPYITPHYAIKCNPDPYVLRLLASLGAGFDCASSGEIDTVLNIGNISPDRIVFANPCKAKSFIRSAAAKAVFKMTFDNEDELYKVKETFPDAKLILRILADDSKSICRFGVKFGAPLDTVPHLLRTARQLDLNVIGVSFHVGSGCYDTSVYADAISRASHAFDIGASLGYKFNLLDLGGGFEDASFESAARVIKNAIQENFGGCRNNALTVIAEPGRFYVSNAFRLATNVIARRMAAPNAESLVDKKVDDPDVMYYINEGTYGAFNCIIYDHQTVSPYALCMSGSFHIPTRQLLTQASVWGPTCDSIDLVCPSTKLPSALRIGDWLGFDKMGAYTICAASRFNGFQLSKIIYTSGDIWSAEIKKRLLSFKNALGCGL